MDGFTVFPKDFIFSESQVLLGEFTVYTEPGDCFKHPPHTYKVAEVEVFAQGIRIIKEIPWKEIWRRSFDDYQEVLLEHRAMGGS